MGLLYILKYGFLHPLKTKMPHYPHEALVTPSGALSP